LSDDTYSSCAWVPFRWSSGGVIQSDGAQLALKTFLAVKPDSHRYWFESENSS